LPRRLGARCNAARSDAARHLIALRGGPFAHLTGGVDRTLVQTRGRRTVKKIIIAVTAAAFMGGVALTPTPASAFLPFIAGVIVLKSKEDKNFKATNPYAKKMAKTMKHKKKM
jgi:hypothetical protein